MLRAFNGILIILNNLEGFHSRQEATFCKTVFSLLMYFLTYLTVFWNSSCGLLLKIGSYFQFSASWITKEQSKQEGGKAWYFIFHWYLWANNHKVFGLQPKLKPKQPVKTKKQKKSFLKKESNVENHKLTSFVCKQASKESQIEWIICKICAVWVHEGFSANEACLLCE